MHFGSEIVGSYPQITPKIDLATQLIILRSNADSERYLIGYFLRLFLPV